MPKQSFAGETYASETSKHRDLLAPYCAGYGIDIGFGGDPITPTALRMDLPQPYARTGDLPVVGAAAAVLLLSLWTSRRRRRTSPSP